MENQANVVGRKSLKERVAQIYYTHGLFCASHPYAVFFITLCILGFSCYPLLNYQLAGNAPQKHSIPSQVYFNKSVLSVVFNNSSSPKWLDGEPVGYVQQIIVKSAVSPWQQYLIPSDAFRTPLSTVYSLLETIKIFQMDNGSHVLSLSNLCSHIGEISSKMELELSQYSCFVISPANLWSQDFMVFQADPNIVATIYKNVKNSANSNININEIIFGVPWSETGLKQYYVRSRQRIVTYAVTIIFKEYNRIYVEGLRNQLMKVYKQEINVSAVDNDSNIFQIYYEGQSQFVEFIPLAGAYVILFLYIYFSVRKIEHVKSKWALATSAVATVIASLLMSVGLCARLGLSFTLNGGEILPFLVVIIGLENMLVLTNSVVSTPPYLDVKIRIAQGLSKEGWSITKNLLTELCILAIGFFTFVPAIQEFCFFAVVGFLSDFFLQLVFFSTILSMGIRGMELCDVHRDGIYPSVHSLSSPVGMHGPLFRCPVTLSTKLSRSKSAPKLQAGAHSDIMVPGTHGTYTNTKILAPKRLRFIYFWARTRMVQRAFMVSMVVWILIVIYKFVIVDHLTETTFRNYARSFAFDNLIDKQMSNLSVQNVSSSSSYQPTVNNHDPDHSPKLLRHKPELWKFLSNKHWPILFGLYNISIYGRYITYLPPIQLSLYNSPEEAVKQRHPQEVDLGVKFKSLWSSEEFKRTLRENLDVSNETVFRGLKEADATVIVLLAIPSLIFIVYVMVILYRCICTRNYAEWRSAWHPNDLYNSDEYSETVHVETLPKTLKGHRQEVECIAVDGSLVASSCLAGEILIWEASTGECLTIIQRSGPRSVHQTRSFDSDENNDGGAQISEDHEMASSRQCRAAPMKRLSLPPVRLQRSKFDVVPDLTHTINTNFGETAKATQPGGSDDSDDFNRFREMLADHRWKQTADRENRRNNHSLESQNDNRKRCHSRSLSVGQDPPSANAHQFSPSNSEPVVSSSQIEDPSPIWCLDFDGSIVAAGCADGSVEFWDSNTGALLCTNKQRSVGVSAIKLVGNIVIVVRLSGSLDFQILESRNPSLETCTTVNVHRRGKLGTNEQEKRDVLQSLQDLSCKIFHSVHAHQQPIRVLAVEGGRAVTGSDDHTLKVFRVEDGCCLFTLHGHGGSITAIHIDKLAPTSTASGSEDGTVCMWDMMTGACIYQLPGHPRGSVLALLYTHIHVISTGTDNRICIWERQQGHLLHSLELEQSYCNSIMMLTSNILVTARQGSLLLWDINAGEPIRFIRLGNSDSCISVRQMKQFSSGVVVDYGQMLKVISFPMMTEKID